MLAQKQKLSVWELIKILEENRNSIIVNLKKLQQNYQRQSSKRLWGYKDENHNIIVPWLRTENIDNSEYAAIESLRFNHNSATVNMLLSRKIRLVKAEDKTPVLEVAGFLVNNLSQFNNYTLVSEGKINVKSLAVKISSEKVFHLLRWQGFIEAEKFDFRREYTIRLDNLPLVNANAYYPKLDGVFEKLAAIKVLSSIISAFLKDSYPGLVPEQLQELKKHYLSPKFYVNFPTTKAYDSVGVLKPQTSYKIDIGNKEILHLGKFYSANKFLNKMYRVYERKTGKILPNPTLKLAGDDNILLRQRLLSSSRKITKVDAFMKRIFDDFLGLENNGAVSEIFTWVGGDRLARRWQQQRHIQSASNKEELITTMLVANAKLKEFAERIYRERVCPLVFYIGCTGFLPEQMNAKAMTAEELTATYPDLQLSKHEREGRFFVVGDSIISIYSKSR